MQLQENLRVVDPVTQSLDRGLIARLFGKGGEPPCEPPCERVEPENARVQSGKPQKVAVAVEHVSALVCHDGRELRRAPARALFRQEDRRAERGRTRYPPAHPRIETPRPWRREHGRFASNVPQA